MIFVDQWHRFLEFFRTKCSRKTCDTDRD
jgi:hypothetical protein